MRVIYPPRPIRKRVVKPNPFWARPSVRSKVKRLLNVLPNDGCLILFNADHNTWRSRIFQFGYNDTIECHVCDPGLKGGANTKYRDLYITWRE